MGDLGGKRGAVRRAVTDDPSHESMEERDLNTVLDQDLTSDEVYGSALLRIESRIRRLVRACQRNPDWAHGPLAQPPGYRELADLLQQVPILPPKIASLLHLRVAVKQKRHAQKIEAIFGEGDAGTAIVKVNDLLGELLPHLLTIAKASKTLGYKGAPYIGFNSVLALKNDIESVVQRLDAWEVARRELESGET